MGRLWEIVTEGNYNTLHFSNRKRDDDTGHAHLGYLPAWNVTVKYLTICTFNLQFFFFLSESRFFNWRYFSYTAFSINVQ